MTASEAKEKMLKAKAKKSVSRIFPVIEKASKEGKGGIRISISSHAKTALDVLTEEEFDILRSEYGYRLEPLYDDSGDYHKSDKKIAYNVLWE